MGSISTMHWLIVVAVVLLLFGRGKIPELMDDVANGIKSFKKGMQDDEPDRKKPAENESAQIGVDRQLSLGAAGAPTGQPGVEPLRHCMYGPGHGFAFVAVQEAWR